MFILVGILSLAVIFYCFRSTKEFPKNFPEFKSEILFQYAGFRGLIEDYWLSKYNRAGNYAGWAHIHVPHIARFEPIDWLPFQFYSSF